MPPQPCGVAVWYGGAGVGVIVLWALAGAVSTTQQSRKEQNKHIDRGDKQEMDLIRNRSIDHRQHIEKRLKLEAVRRRDTSDDKSGNDQHLRYPVDKSDDDQHKQNAADQSD